MQNSLLGRSYTQNQIEAELIEIKLYSFDENQIIVLF